MGMVLCLRRILDEEAFRAAASDLDDLLQFLESAEEDDYVDFDKAWQALHFILTGSPYEGDPPLNFLLQAGEETGEDIGYGPARFASPDEVRDFRNAFAKLTDAELRRRYDPERMVAADVYLADSLADEGEEGWDYVFQSVPALRALLERCVAEGSGIAIWIS